MFLTKLCYQLLRMFLCNFYCQSSPPQEFYFQWLTRMISSCSTPNQIFFLRISRIKTDLIIWIHPAAWFHKLRYICRYTTTYSIKCLRPHFNFFSGNLFHQSPEAALPCQTPTAVGLSLRPLKTEVPWTTPAAFMKHSRAAERLKTGFTLPRKTWWHWKIQTNKLKVTALDKKNPKHFTLTLFPLATYFDKLHYCIKQ